MSIAGKKRLPRHRVTEAPFDSRKTGPVQVVWSAPALPDSRQSSHLRVYEPPGVEAALEGEICRNVVAQPVIECVPYIYRDTAITIVADLDHRGKARSAAMNRLPTSLADMMSCR